MSAYKEKNRSFFFWLFFGVLLPIFIVGIIAIAILSMAGVDVGGIAKEKLNGIPVITSFMTSDEEKQLSQKLEKAKATISTQKETISDLEKDVSSMKKNIDELELDLKKQQKNEATDPNVETEPDEEEEIKKAASSFRKMDPEKAANIIQQLETIEATQILSSLPGEVRGDILAEMDAKEAATLMEFMMQ